VSGWRDPTDCPMSEWVRDGAATGGLSLTAAIGGFVATVFSIDGMRGALSQAVVVWVVAAVAGGVLGALLGGAAFLLVRELWPRSRAAAFAVGPFLGSVGAVGVMRVLTAVFDGTSSDGAYALVATLGTLAVGPTWLGWLGVRAQGRATWPVGVATAGWSATLTVGLVSGLWVLEHV
jgi:hypothetical protein